MCGLVGIVGDSLPLKDALSSAVSSLRRRGPDGEGIWLDPIRPVGFGHTRLSILDLSEAAHQPMVSAYGRYTVTFNGEIFNFKQLRGELERLNYPFRGTGDTEVLLAAFESWGIKESCSRFEGMFAFGVFDRETDTVTLGRDRFGKKPLYYGLFPGAFIFGSELAPFHSVRGLPLNLSPRAVQRYLQHGYVPAPESIYNEVFKLIPGTLLTLPVASIVETTIPLSPLPGGVSGHSPEYYWDPIQRFIDSKSDPFMGSIDEAEIEVERLLRSSVRGRLISDVPVGGFLSGGIDSSLVMAIAAEESTGGLETFSIGFNESEYNEAPYAKKVADYLGVSHNQLILNSSEAIALIPSIPHAFSEPFADASQIPTLALSRFTRSKVTVALSGDGGDEGFGGYNRYTWISRILDLQRTLGPKSCKLLAGAIESVPSDLYGWVSQILRGVAPSLPIPANLGFSLFRMAQILRSSGARDAYQKLVSLWDLPPLRSPLTGNLDPRRDELMAINRFNAVDQIMLLDTLDYLPNDILTKVDRASMFFSLEARCPLLDYRLLEFAWRLPLKMKIQNKERKLLLRRLLFKKIPRTLLERPKMGFGVPIDHWLRGPLKEWASDLLSPGMLDRSGYFDSEKIQKLWGEHLSGSRSWQYHLWPILMFQAWYTETNAGARLVESQVATDHRMLG